MDITTGGTGGKTASGTTQYAASNLEVRSVSDLTGRTNGDYKSADIDKNGYVEFNYSNSSKLKPYRIPLITFGDANKLDRLNGALFTGDGVLAGEPTAHWSGEENAGNIMPNSLEGSNVDLANEMTKMIVAQRAYSASAKGITTVDQMLQDAMGFKH